MLKHLLPFTLILLIFSTNTYAQDEGKKKLEQDFEQYKKEQQQDYEQFKKKREAELKKMAQEYKDYYNGILGLKTKYSKTNNTQSLTVVNEIIDFENNVTEAVGNPVTKIEPAKVKLDEPTVTAKPISNINTTATVKKESKKEEEVFSSSESDRDNVPSLIPVPKSKAKITSPFGLRLHPVLLLPIKHNGVDFGTGRGTPVYASANGKVVIAKYNKSYGNYVVIEHAEGVSTVYAHLESIKTSEGNMIKKGSIIGYTGSTGRATGPHLHYEVRIKGIPVNPKGYLVENKE
ncbi:MAG: peptidoglycan DD-metalloendopeptidase family protein [Bacteroidales bacterium]|nr:peptidoglycan DD-metalloendopeptidase family protein [Bacteroidales bacterium]HRX32159.1 peptidoglycan DD-metalloendopeptidase family protein [Tenuifilaceae bacterium]